MLNKSTRNRHLIENFDTFVIYLLIGFIIGIRLGHFIFYNFDTFKLNPLAVLNIFKYSGFSSHGGAIGLIVAGLLFIKKYKGIKFFDYADIISVCATIPIATVRLGNFFNSEIVGKVTSVPWGVVFTKYDGFLRHPSQIYEFLIAIFLFFILFPTWLKKHKVVRPGFFFGLLLTLYFAMRFVIEYTKEFPVYSSLNLTTGQILGIPFFMAGVVALYKTQTRKNK